MRRYTDAVTSAFSACGTAPATGWVDAGDAVAAITSREIWLDATRPQDITLATGVSDWADATRNGRSFVQAVGSKQPLVVPNIINGLPIVRFDGVDDVLAWAMGTAELKNGSTIFLVASPQFPNTVGRPLLRHGVNCTGLQHEANDDPTTGSRSKLEAFAATNAGLLRATPAGVTANGFRVITARVAPAEPTINLYKNGVLDGGPTAGFASLTSSIGDTMRLCSDGTAFGTYDIGELIVISRAVTTAERQIAEAYLMLKWALP